ncbi:MAG: EF-P beta-lysylation protein EpmB [Gammaproteobacteria bacterium]|nr:EF-P beta-lysylation protein EpmB [Gammaproteobacteria bacterium]
MLARAHDPDAWRTLLATAVTDSAELLRRLELSQHPLAATLQPGPSFPVRVPEPYLACMRRGDPEDPLLRQVLALADEAHPVPGFSTDPLGEAGQNPLPGLLHKYRGRALLIAAGGCAVHCRYCFRRHFPYGENNPGRRGLEAALGYLAAHPDIREVILSGGDPLMLDDEALGWLVQRLEQIPHLTRLRIHTRFPVVIPQRLTPQLVALLAGTRLRSVVVLHVNHARELGTGVTAAVLPLRQAGIPLFNQAVLLKGVNDDLATLIDLCEQSFDAGIQPYYLHLLDRVAGAAHFEVPVAEARRLYEDLASGLPGYLLPRLVRERAGAPGKVVLAPRWEAL